MESYFSDYIDGNKRLLLAGSAEKQENERKQVCFVVGQRIFGGRVLVVGFWTLDTRMHPRFRRIQ